MALLSVVGLMFLFASAAAGRTVLRWVRRPWETPPREVFTASLLPNVRRAAAAVPGDPPRSLHVHVVVRYERIAAEAVEGAPTESVPAVRAAYQIRYPRSWIMVDAGHVDNAVDSESHQLLQRALVDAQLIVFTHEHHDHLGGVVGSPRRVDLERNTLLTRPQLQRLLSVQLNSPVHLEPDEAARFLSFDYDPFVPIAPGVVLIKAPGHTPASQFVYVRLDSGREIVLAGDVAYLELGIEEGRQKPESVYLDEDRIAIATELAWLRAIGETGVSVLLSHDYGMLLDLIERGIVEPQLDLSPGLEDDIPTQTSEASRERPSRR